MDRKADKGAEGMSSGMNMQEAEKVAEKMSYRQAVFNCLNARCVQYRKATKIKMRQLLEIAEKRDEQIKHDAKVRKDAIDECIEALGNNIWDIAKLENLKEQQKDNGMR